LEQWDKEREDKEYRVAQRCASSLYQATH